MKKFLQVVKTIIRSTRFAWSFAPMASVVLLVLNIGISLVPILSAKITGTVIDSIISGLSKGTIVPVGLIVLYGVVWGSSRILSAVSDYCDKRWTLDVQHGVDLAVLKKRATLDLAHYENPEFQNLMTRAFVRGNGVITNLADMQFRTFALLASVIVSSFVIIRYPLIFGLILVSLIPSFVVDIKYGNRQWTIWGENSERRRRFDHLRWHITGRVGVTQAKNLQTTSKILAMAEDILHSFKKDQWRVDTARFWWGMLSAICVAFGFGYSFWILVRYALAGAIPVGEIVFLVSVMGQFIGSANSFLTGFARQYEQSLYVKDIFEVLDTKPHVIVPLHPTRLGLTTAPRIEFKNVWFRYDEKSEWVLKDMSITIEPGEKIALVGENGAGKTTFLKLLTRVYDPTKGTILIDGVNLRDVAPDEWMNYLAILLQEYLSYDFPTWESIAMGRSSETPSRERAIRAARLAGADEFIDAWEQTYDTQLGREFTGGVEPSKGQQQKLAIARTLYREGLVVVLDEPTASVDALAEERIFSQMEEAISGRTLILVSHRFNTVQGVDRILVFSHGELVESGSHRELVQKDGYYNKMWESQAKSYLAAQNDDTMIN